MIRLYEQTGMPAEAVAQLEKAAALSPEPDDLASLRMRMPSQARKERR
jgi:hypothetical protein